MMSHRRRLLTLAIAAAWLSPGLALSADYDPPIFVEEAVEEYVPVEVGSGWYLRGDVGYIVNQEYDRFGTRSFYAPHGSYTDGEFDDAELDADFTAGVGVGYRFTDYLRSDVTVEGFRGDFKGETTSDRSCDDEVGFSGTTCRSEDSADFSAVSAMANAYVDLGTYVGLTPYLGAGAGYTYLRWSDLDTNTYCVHGQGFCPEGYAGETSSDGEEDWRLTYSLMAGAAYDLTNYLKVDLGYKYRRIESGDMFGWDDSSADLGATGSRGTDSDLSQHEVKVGLRYELW